MAFLGQVGLGEFNDNTDPLRLPFYGGCVGFFSYDFGRNIERLPDLGKPSEATPDCFFACYTGAYVYDHQSDTLWLTANGDKAQQGSMIKVLEGWLDEMPRETEPDEVTVDVRQQMANGDYCAMVGRAIDYIRAGDIYQVNLAHRFEIGNPPPSPELYMRLRDSNPAPFSLYMDFGDGQVLSTSPERFLEIEGRRIRTRPIKGTRPKAAAAIDNETVMAELVHCPKERAELLMIVDLERNDLGRVCDFGSVRVNQLYGVESFATVHHLVAEVEGHLRAGLDFADVLLATFPGGSITGAPKVRAMEIIHELEPCRRGLYCGCMGYMRAHGRADFNIALRALVARGKQVWFDAGAGIVADSVPEKEYLETLAKAEGILRALNVLPLGTR